jgi:hypothetical protein
MKQYHENWLEAHPHRTREWLEAKCKDGFDIHHLDGNHDNNDPGNLVLIEASDHMRLHGMDHKGKGILRMHTTVGPRKKTLEVGEAAYLAAQKILEGDDHPKSVWEVVSAELELVGHRAICSARTWAKHSGREWPLVTKNKKPITKEQGRPSMKDKSRPIRKFFDTSYRHDYIPPRRVVGHRP